MEEILSAPAQPSSDTSARQAGAELIYQKKNDKLDKY